MRAELRVEYGPSEVARVSVEERPLVLGRAPDVDVQIADQRLSRHHCRVELVGDRLMVTDLGSSNGTYFKNQRVQSVMLGAGDAFYIGNTKIVLESVAPTEPKAAHVAARIAAGRAAAELPDAPARPGAYEPTPTIDVAPPPGARASPTPTLSVPPPGAGAARPAALDALRPTQRDVPAPGAKLDKADRAGRSAGLEVSPIEGYEILGRLGEGSMGTVYKARRVETGEICVLKMMKISGNPQDAIFFIRECQAGMKLKHPNVVELLEFGESGGFLFLAMEYVEGGNLLDRIKRDGPLPQREALRQMREVCDALGFAFRKKIVHRDIKPANVLLAKSGQAKLADFGLAKTIKQAGAAGLTQAGEARGTPIYMAPEMLTSAGEADQRADIYSLGATYYHALCGQHPFRAPSVAEILRMVVQEEPPRLEERRPDLYPDLARMIRKMMAKKPADRFREPAELSAEIERIERAIA
jgi:tRNA A-37 threonylcarbamoyl transferase component Bud32